MSLPPWLKKEKSPQDRGRDFEKKIAKKCKVKPQPGSGNTPFYKEDLQPGEYLVQVKSSGKKQHTVKKEDLQALRVNAAKIGKYPMYLFEIDGEIWSAVPVSNEMLEKLRGESK